MLSVTIRRSETAARTITLLALAAALAALFDAPSAAEPVVSLLIVDAFALFFTGLLVVIAVFVVLLSRDYLAALGQRAVEFHMLLLMATLGAAVLVGARHMAALFLGLELLSVSLYALIAYTRERALSIEAGVKYLILASVSSAFLLFGLALVYHQMGTLGFAELAALLVTENLGSDPIVLGGLGLMVVGFGFKLAVAPFHLWTPDVYQGAPAPVTAFIATASKSAVLALLLRFGRLSGDILAPPLWLGLAVVAGASMLVGNLLALLQMRVKRILAYSSIAHLGYVLVAFLAGPPSAVSAVLFYMVAYSVTTLVAFGVITVLSGVRRSRTVNKEAVDGEDCDRLDDYRGLGRRRPWLAALLAAALLSLAGIPLTAGFIGKYLVVTAGVGSALWALVMLMIGNSAVGIYYYLRVIVTLYLEDQEDGAAAQRSARSRVAWDAAAALFLLAILLVGLGIYPRPILWLIAQSPLAAF
ncbi:MAG: NADH-quinone oxidoreductase subunit NuoN [Candidatus Eisenbacteria bacterium]|nr:NADH-quinone oxidoreductase subunit NuoN [Candidatus Eisenbacteria bacterium]